VLRIGPLGLYILSTTTATPHHTTATNFHFCLTGLFFQVRQVPVGLANNLGRVLAWACLPVRCPSFHLIILFKAWKELTEY